MPQTLMALLALTLTIFFVFNQQRNVAQVRQAMVRNEIMSQATSVASDRLEEIGAMAFDERTKGETPLTAATSLTAAGVFTVDAPPIDDIDDFDGASVTQFRVAWTDTLWFRVASRVRYADPADPAREVTARTKFKKVTVTVSSLDDALADTVRISQAFACGSKCAW